MGENFNSEDSKNTNIKETLGEYLTNYVGVLPKYLLLYITDYSQYEDNLRKHGKYDKVMKEYYKIRIERKKSKDRQAYDEEQLNTFLKNNPEINNMFTELVKNGDG